MADKTITGAIAIIKYNGRAVGYMRGVQASENIGRQPVKELGNIIPVEGAVVSWAGSISCSFWEVDFEKSGIPQAIKRDVQTNEEFQDNLVLDYEGVKIDIYKKVIDIIDPETKKITPRKKPYASISRCMIESDSIDINEGSVGGRNQSFMFLDPIILPK